MIKTIKLRGVDVDVKELTFAQLDEVMASAQNGASIVDKVFNADMVTEHMLALCTGLPVEEIRACRASELRPLVDAVREVHPDFLAGMASLAGGG